ncbi:AraC-like ligand-binding domain-containing protein [Streptomyces glaucescens]
MAGAERADVWERSVRRRLAGVDVTPRPSPAFTGNLSVHDLGYLRILSLEADAVRLSRTARLVAAAPHDHIILAVQMAGTSALRQDGRDAVLRPGDLAVCDLRRPFSFEQRRRFNLHMLRVPERALGRSGSRVHRLTGRAVPARGGVAALLLPFVSSLVARAGRTSAPIADQLAGTFADLLATLVDEHTLGSRPETPTARQDLVRRVRDYVDANLRDPDLSPARIAAAHRISVRYLHLLFEDQETTVHKLVLRRRVEECAGEIARRGTAPMSLSAVARAWGFQNVAQFSRSFKAVHGCSFRDWHAGGDDSREAVAAPSSK